MVTVCSWAILSSYWFYDWCIRSTKLNIGGWYLHSDGLGWVVAISIAQGEKGSRVLGIFSRLGSNQHPQRFQANIGLCWCAPMQNTNICADPESSIFRRYDLWRPILGPTSEKRTKIKFKITNSVYYSICPMIALELFLGIQVTDSSPASDRT